MFPAYNELKKILNEAMEAGIIHDYCECPGVPRIDIIPVDDAPVNHWIQIEVIK